MFKTVLVANRGEIALRVIRACREMGIRSVAVYSEADRLSPYVARADEAHLLGPAPPRESYLRIGRIIEIAKKSGAQAIHPGYGFLSENADFAEACAKNGLRFIGPPPSAMRAVGNKIAARRAARKLGVPVVPGVGEPVDESTARTFGRKHRYPVLLKAAAGGGGRGMRVVRRPGDIPRAMREAAGEAEAAFGDGTLFIEKYLARPRHVEIQVMADSRGRVIHLGERECSIQRRHQKLVEESPSPAVDARMRHRMGETACRLLRSVGYQNAGTCEFLLDGGRFYFLEVNARLQVEHPVTEMVTGLDLVQLQIAAAAGERLPLAQGDVQWRGHAIQTRLCAEDPAADFAPAAGRILEARFPSGPFVRVDSDLAPGAEVTVHYDSLLAKLLAWAEDREGAIDRAIRALRETAILGVPTTVPFHLQLLQNRKFRAGRIHTRFLEDGFDPGKTDTKGREDAVVLAAALDFLHRDRTRPDRNGPVPLSAWKLAFREEPWA